MDLIDVLRPECVEAGAKLADKEEALRHIARLAAKCSILQGVSEEVIFEGLRDREALGSTGFGDGIAIPHCRLEGVAEFVAGVVTVPDGVAFDALDGEPVRIFVFIVAPERATNDHVRLLASISQALSVPGAAKEILGAGTADALRESFLRHGRDELEVREDARTKLFLVAVRDEDAFQDVLPVLAGTGARGAVVLEGQQSGRFLAKMPLFAGFWSDEADTFCRLILAVVEERLANETIRRIERAVGRLDGRTDMLVLVQDVFYAAGSLQA